MTVSIPKDNSGSGKDSGAIITRKHRRKSGEARVVLPPPFQAPQGEPPVMEVVTSVENEAFLNAWQQLADESVDDNPFLSPSFLIPALVHLYDDAPMTLTAAWQTHGNKRMLTGIFALQTRKRFSLRNWWSGGEASLWTHPLVPFNAPLLAFEPDIADATIASFLLWLSAGRPRLTTLKLPHLLKDSHAYNLFESEISRFGMQVQYSNEQTITRGLDFKPSHMPFQIEKVIVSREAQDVKAALEKAFCLESQSAENDARMPLLSDIHRSAFLRAVVRGFATQGKACIVVMDEPKAKAAAILIEGKASAYLWQIMGPDSTNPMVEAALAAAAEKAIGKPLLAASDKTLSGLWAKPIVTENLVVQFM